MKVIRSQSEHAPQNFKLGMVKPSILSPLFMGDSKRGNEGIHSLLYKARNNVMYNSEEKQKFKQAIRDINPQMGLAQIVTLGSEKHLKETRHSPGSSYVSYQLTHTESNYNVCVDISSVLRGRKNNQPLTYPRFPLRDRGPPTVQNNQLTAAERNLYESLCINEDIVNTIKNETTKVDLLYALILQFWGALQIER